MEALEKTQDLRLNLLKTAEDGLRNGVLKSNALHEEVNFLRDKLEVLGLKQIDIPETEIADLKARLAKAYEGSVVGDED